MRRTRTFVRRTRPKINWQWARETSNDVVIITPPSYYLEDLLASFKSAYGFNINFPDIVIWRIHLRISVTVRFPASIVNPEAYGVLVTVYPEDMNFIQENAVTHPYMERFMYYKTLYYSEAVLGGEAQPVANSNGTLFHEFDIKAHRRLANLEDTLILQVAPTGGLASLQGLSWSSSVLLKMGKR